MYGFPNLFTVTGPGSPGRPANAAATLLPTANSWYLGANVPGQPRVFMPFVGGIALYRDLCDEVRAGGHTGFDRRPAKDSVPA